MARRLMKALEDLSMQYDRTVRNSEQSVVQFTYGDDGLNPNVMEKKDRPVDYSRMTGRWLLYQVYMQCLCGFMCVVMFIYMIHIIYYLLGISILCMHYYYSEHLSEHA